MVDFTHVDGKYSVINGSKAKKPVGTLDLTPPSLIGLSIIIKPGVEPILPNSRPKTGHNSHSKSNRVALPFGKITQEKRVPIAICPDWFIRRSSRKEGARGVIQSDLLTLLEEIGPRVQR